jgi:TPR repeat protein
MKRTLLFALALAVIPVGVDAQVTPSASCADIALLTSLSQWREAVRTCAEQGDAEAQFHLGSHYATGSGSLPEDFVESVRWYRLAAEQGHGGAQTSLGFRYRYGRGVPEDDVEAVRWFRLAAEQGNAEAQYNLGTLYDNGEGVPEDHVLAYMWYNLAAAQGHERAQDGKDLIEEDMTREQIAEAQRLSTEWLEAHPPGGN